MNLVLIAKPETVMRWQRDRFRRHWTAISQPKRPGRPRIAAEVAFVKAMGTKPCRTAYRCPWQNPVAERWTGGARRDIFGHVVLFDERHAVRLGRLYRRYFYEDRTHLGLDKDTPEGRDITPRPSANAKVVALPRIGGLHHRYAWRDAA